MTSAPTTSNTQRRGDLRRQRLKQAVTSLLAEQTFDVITYREIAALADLPLASCYHFYPSKLALVRSIADDMTDEYLSKVFDSSLYQGIDTLEGLLKQWIEIAASHHMKSVAELEIFFGADIPMSVRNDSLEREKLIALRLLSLIEDCLGRIALKQPSNVLYYAIELARTCLALDYQEHRQLTPEGIERAQIAATTYTLAHM